MPSSLLDSGMYFRLWLQAEGIEPVGMLHITLVTVAALRELRERRAPVASDLNADDLDRAFTAECARLGELPMSYERFTTIGQLLCWALQRQPAPMSGH